MLVLEDIFLKIILTGNVFLKELTKYLTNFCFFKYGKYQ